MLRDDEYYRAPLIWIVVPYAAGLTVACLEIGKTGLVGAIVALLLVALALMSTSKKTRRANILWGTGIAAAACLGGTAHMHHALRDQPRWQSLPARETVITVEVVRVFHSPPNSDRMVGIGRIEQAPAVVGDLVGQRTFFALDKQPDAAPLLRSSAIEIKGILQPLEAINPPRGSFEAYLLSNAVRFRIDRTEKIATIREPGWLPRFWNLVGRRFETILLEGLPAEHSGTKAYSAMMLGRKSELTDKQKEVFLYSGTMHLFAISGLHIGVIAVSLSTVLSLCRVPRITAMIIGLLLLTVFVEATGGTPSERRALMMVAFLWIGSSLRRPSNPLASLVASAWFVLMLDPLALLSTSFQLSYAVVAVILLYGAPLRNGLHRRVTLFNYLPIDEWRWWHRRTVATIRGTITVFCVSFSAMLVSAPLGLDAFGVTAPGAILSNVLIMPLAGLAITGGFAALLTGLLGVVPLSMVFNHAAVLLLDVIGLLARGAVAAPFMHATGSFARDWMAPGIVLLAIALCIVGYSIRWHRIPGGFWSAPAAVLVLMLLLVTWT